MGDLVPPGKPDTRPGGCVGQEAVQSADAGGTTDDAKMQAHGHHPRLGSAFAVQAIKRIDAIARKIISEHEAAVVVKAHIVGVESVRQHDVVVPRSFDQIRQIVVVGVRIVEKASVFHQQPPGIGRRRRARVPTHGRQAGRILDCRDGTNEFAPLACLVLIDLPLPAPTMR